MQNTKFHEELKNLSIKIYPENQNMKIDNWICVSQKENKKNGFYAETYVKGKEVVIVFRGTELSSMKDIENDSQMYDKHFPSQIIDARKYYNEISKKFNNGFNITFTGHSLGGSLSQIMGYETGKDTVTFNAYGVKDILQTEENPDNIINYGNKKDSIFMKSIDNQLGKTLITNIDSNSKYVAKGKNTDIYSPTEHELENMDKLEDAKEYIPYNFFKASIEKCVDLKDFDTKRIFTNEEIGKMSKEEFKKNEDFIHQQMNLGNVMTKVEADEKMKSGEVIWVDDYVRGDGTHVSGYYRRK